MISISFAIYREHRAKTLATMEFREPSKSNPATKIVKKDTLQHGTVIRFDAIRHKKRGMEHRVAKHAFPRVNVTLRHLKSGTNIQCQCENHLGAES